ncbi:MAG TPA: HEPN domain-containing protein [Candidatus Methanoperedens sp.]
MFNEKDLSNQDKAIETIINNRSYIETEIDRILKKSHSIKIKAEKKKQIVDFLFQNLPDLIKCINLDINFEQIETLEQKSKYDIELAKMAYKLKDYGNALFHLQQAIEKATKAYGLYFGIIKDPQKEISHKTPKIFIKLLRLSWVDDLTNIYNRNYNLQKNLANLDILMKDENKASILDLDNNIPFFLNLYKNILKNTKRTLSRREIKRIVDYVKINYGIDIKEIYMMQIEFVLLLYLFSFITFIYAVEPRYSNEIEYNKLNVIKYFNNIMKLLDE